MVLVSLPGAAQDQHGYRDRRSQARDGCDFPHGSFMTLLCQSASVLVVHRLDLASLWVPKTCATWADALQIAVGSVPRSGAGRQVLVRPEMG